MSSICLVTISDGLWASGILINSQGLILTNAHLLEPWRFGKAHVSCGGYGTNLDKLPFKLEGAADLRNGIESIQKTQTLPLKMRIVYSFTADEPGEYKLNTTYKNHKNIRVRVDHVNPSVWSGARVVYICRGPWDVALLQLESVPDKVLPVEMNFSRPSTGSKAYVIGDGLFGPKCAKEFEAKPPQSYESIQPELMHMHGLFPAMLETTAVVHSGASGGTVINSDGHMIGLVTSNARHGGGVVIPHLNFSIPSAALVPIFKFSKDMQKFWLLRILDEPDEYISSVWATIIFQAPCYA